MMTLEQQQCLLGALGYYTLRRRDGSLAVDDIPGPASEKAIREAQEDLNLPVTGVWDDRTEELICERIGNRQFPASIPPPVPEWEDSVWEDPYIARYLPHSEWACPCHRCGGYPVEPHPDLVRAAADLRRRAVEKVPTTCFNISSGVRCQAHNDELPGSVPDSRHVRGRAVDFSLPGISPAETLQMALETPGIVYAYIMSSGWVHMDIGN